jgi:2-polyprenyl-6-methoxyphenol hydroxylase-like FAD-dependent oxidoreductase
MHFIIVGCGIGGISTAIGLVKKHVAASGGGTRGRGRRSPNASPGTPPPFTITLIDSLTYAGLLGTSSSGYDFSPSGVAAIFSLSPGDESVWTALRRASYKSDALIVEDAQRSGKTAVLSLKLSDVPAYPRGTLTLTRSDFIRTLFNCLAADYGYSSFPKQVDRLTLDAPGLPTVRIILGDGLRRVRRWGNDRTHRQPVSVELDSGRIVSGTVLIGADGVHSRIARLVQPSLGTDRMQQRQVALWIRTEEAAHAPVPTSAPPLGTFVMATCDRAMVFYGRMVRDEVPDSRSNFIVVCFTHEEGMQSIPRGERLDVLRQIIRERHPRGASHLLASLAKARIEDVCGTNLYEPAPGKMMKAANRGSVVVIGDALHPFTPFLGQGASQALVDADALSTVLLAPNVAPTAALAAFSRARVGPTNKLVRESATMGSLMDRPRLSRAMHSAIRVLPASYVARRFFSADRACFPEAVRAEMFKQ